MPVKQLTRQYDDCLVANKASNDLLMKYVSASKKFLGNLWPKFIRNIIGGHDANCYSESYVKDNKKAKKAIHLKFIIRQRYKALCF